jgi:hypothetical protein
MKNMFTKYYYIRREELSAVTRSYGAFDSKHENRSDLRLASDARFANLLRNIRTSCFSTGKFTQLSYHFVVRFFLTTIIIRIVFNFIYFSQNIPIIIDERISEHLADISDIGRPKSALMKEFLCPQLRWEKIKELWWYTPQGPVSTLTRQ